MSLNAMNEKAIRPPPGEHSPIRRGQLYWVAPEECHGSIPAINHPYVVVQDDLFNASRISTVVVCGITSNLKRASEPGAILLEPGEGGLQRQSVVLASQISSVPKAHLGECIGMLSEQRFEQILENLRFLQNALVGHNAGRPNPGRRRGITHD